VSSAQPSVPEPVVLVVMGVSGSGKSRVAGLLAGRLGWDLEEGDDLHPWKNIVKMSAGVPLTDDDRWPWLAKVGAWIRERTDVGRCGVITSSALKRRYRDVLRGPHVVFVHLTGSRDVIAGRLAARHGHFMPPALLDSQFAALEPPGPDERSIDVDVALSPTGEADQIIARLGLTPEGATGAEAPS
jgi:gluconokinase